MTANYYIKDKKAPKPEADFKKIKFYLNQFKKIINLLLKIVDNIQNK